MLAAAFLGLAYCALPTLFFGLIRPYTVSMGIWPTTRAGVCGLAFLQFFLGGLGFRYVYEAGKFGIEPSMPKLTLAIVGISAASALYRLAKGPRPGWGTERSGTSKRKAADADGTARRPEPAYASAAAPGSTPHAPEASPLDGLAPAARADLRTAMENVAKLRRWISVFDGHPLEAILGRIAEHADTTIKEVMRDTGDFARVRQALVHHLSHVVAVVDHLATVHIATGREELLDRTAATLERLVPVFESFRDRAFDNDALQLDARLKMLDQEILAHGPQPQRAAGG